MTKKNTRGILDRPETAPPLIRSVRPTIRCGDVTPAATLEVDNPDHNPALVDHLVGNWIPESGFSIFDLPDAWPNGPFGVTLHVTADGYVDFHTRFVLADFEALPGAADNPQLRIQLLDGQSPPPPALDYALTPAAPPIRLLALHPDGEGFTDAAGARWTQIGCSDFRLLERYLAGEDIDPILAERQWIGFNQLRVFLMCGNMFHLFPQQIPDYQARLRSFCDHVAAFGLRLELTALVDATVVMPHLADQQAFWKAVCATVAGLPYVFLELVNEVDQTINVIDPSQFSAPASVIACHGSKGIVDAAAEPVCVVPVWSYGVLHPKRTEDWPRFGHNIHEDIWLTLHVCGTINESCRPNQGRGPIPSDFYDAAVNMGIMGAGGTFHSEAGKASTLFASDEYACAEAWTRGARQVNLSARTGQYVAGHLHIPPLPVGWVKGDSVRAHGRIVGSRAYCSLPQMRDGYVPVGQDGWTISFRDGSYVELVR